MDISEISVAELVQLYSQSIKELKRRGIIRTNNVIGDLGEYLAIDYYNKTLGLPNLQAAPIGTENIDAISRNGERYSIKSTSTSTTGVFYGLNSKGVADGDKQKFEYVIICKFDNNFQLEYIYELNWEDFIEHKRWHSRMNAWNLSLTQKMIGDCKIIYEK